MNETATEPTVDPVTAVFDVLQAAQRLSGALRGEKGKELSLGDWLMLRGLVGSEPVAVHRLVRRTGLSRKALMTRLEHMQAAGLIAINTSKGEKASKGETTSKDEKASKGETAGTTVALLELGSESVARFDAALGAKLEGKTEPARLVRQARTLRKLAADLTKPAATDGEAA